MYKVFVVDDEPSVLEGMKIMIPWEKLDFELCGAASNAQETLVKIEELRPHLLITDIRMPHKSGLELIKEVRKLNIDMEFVILSGYSEFSYAQEAMRHQVFHYLLKPLDEEEMISVLEKIKHKLDSIFLTEYGFTQKEIEALKINRNTLPQETNHNASNARDTQDRWKFIRNDFDEELTKALKLMSQRDAKKLIDELFSSLKSKAVSLAEARVLVNSCIYRILRIAYERNIQMHIILPRERSEELSLDELKKHVTSILSKTISLMLEDRRKNSRSYLYRVKTYIDHHFIDDLSVSSLAEMEFLEAGYLGEAFIKQFGCSINEYQHQLRIKKAIELIQTTDMKLSDISSAVGYNNYNNFFSHFEKITNMKPAQYYAESSRDSQ